jgi:hypothetical protein
LKPSDSFPAPHTVNCYAGINAHPPNGRPNDLATLKFAPPINDHLADGGRPAERPRAPVRVALIGRYRLRRERPFNACTLASCLTVLQLVRLSLPGRCKANHISGFGLALNESTGKVRYRNMIRKTGVRIQAVADAEQVWNAGLPGTSE